MFVIFKINVFIVLYTGGGKFQEYLLGLLQPLIGRVVNKPEGEVRVQLYLEHFSKWVRSWTGFTELHEGNWVTTWMKSSKSD